MSSRYSFGEYVLDAQSHSLCRGRREISLGARAFGVLELLVVNAGRVVSRRELIDGVWHEIAVSDDSLARAVSDIRTALGDDASHPQYIRTVHRQGYLLVAPVTPLPVEAPLSGAGDGRSPWRWARNPYVLATLTVVVLVSALALRGRVGPAAAGGSPSLPDFVTWRLRALGPSPFTRSAIKPAFAKSENLLSVVAPDPGTDAHSLFLLRPGGGEPLQLTRGIEVRGPTPEFTADDSSIIFTSYRSDRDLGLVPDVWLAPVPAGEPTLLMERASAASSSPDGSGLAYAAVTADGTSIRVRHQDGRNVEVAERGFWPRWSPDGRWIAYTTSDPEGGDGTLHVVRPDGSGHRELTTTSSQFYGLSWTPDSSRVIFASEQGGPTALWSVDVESGQQVAVTRGPGICTSPTMSPDGRRLVFDFSHRRWHLYLASDLTAPAQRVLMEPGMQDAALSPGGDRIALALGAAAQSPAVSVLDLDTMERQTLSGMAAAAVAWTPDGDHLLIAAPAPDGIHNWIWRLPVGGGLPDPILKGQGHWGTPSPSPDGLLLAAVRRSEAGCELVVHDVGRGNHWTLAEKATISVPRWSPDGRLLTWSGKWRPDDLESGGVWVSAAEEGTPRRLTTDGAWPVWEADGKHLLFVRFLEHEGIWRVPLAGGSPELVRRLEGELRDLYMEGLDIGRSGAPLLLFLSRSAGELYVLEAPAD